MIADSAVLDVLFLVEWTILHEGHEHGNESGAVDVQTAAIAVVLLGLLVGATAILYRAYVD